MDEPDWNFPDGRFLSYVLAAARTAASRCSSCSTAPTMRSNSPSRNGPASRAGCACSTPQRTAGRAALTSRQRPAMRRHARCRPSRAGRDGCTALRAAAHGATASPSVCGRRPRSAVTLLLDRPTRDERDAGGWFEAHVPDARRRHALPIPHRRRNRNCRSGLALPAGRRARAERSDRSHRLTMAGARTGADALGARRLS